MKPRSIRAALPRKVTRKIAAASLGVAATAIATTGLFSAGPPASASTSPAVAPIATNANGIFVGVVSETYGAYSVGAPNLSLYAPVDETSAGRYIDFVPTSTKYEYLMRLNADQHLCVAASDSGVYAVLHECNGSGVVWISELGQDGHSYLFQNRLDGLYLSGKNNGSQFVLRGWKYPGAFQQFKLTAA